MNGRPMQLALLLALVAGSSLFVSRANPQADDGAPVPAAVRAAPLFVIDHTMVDAAQIPQEWLDAARELDTFFAHRSLGNNIIDGLLDLQATNSERYTIAFGTSGPGWFDDHSGISHVALGSNKYPQTKIDGFDDLIRGGYSRADLAMMKFCPGDSIPFGTMPAAEIWREYREMMIHLEEDYPELALVWWTFPLSTASDNRGNNEKAIFNAAVRQYCAASGCRLFDIADIQSHDPGGSPVVSATGHEAMWDGYSDDGGHLNTTGRVRVAGAFWWLLATAAQAQTPAPWVALAVEPDQLTLRPQEVGQLDVTVTASADLSAPVTLSLEGMPAGMTPTISPNPVTPPATARVTLVADSTTPLGESTITVAATSGQVSATAAVQLTLVPAPTFSVDVEPGWQQAEAGEVVTYTISLQSDSAFDDKVDLTVANLPHDMEAVIAGSPLVPPASTELQIMTSANTPGGNYDLAVTGTSSGQTVVTGFDLTIVTSAPTFTLTISPTELIVFADRVATYVVEATRSSGFEAPISLEVIGLPVGVGVVWEGNPLLPNGNAQLRLSIPRRPRYGPTTLVVIGTSGEMVVSDTAELIVYAGGFMPFLVR